MNITITEGANESATIPLEKLPEWLENTLGASWHTIANIREVNGALTVRVFAVEGLVPSAANATPVGSYTITPVAPCDAATVHDLLRRCVITGA